MIDLRFCPGGLVMPQKNVAGAFPVFCTEYFQPGAQYPRSPAFKASFFDEPFLTFSVSSPQYIVHSPNNK